MLKRNGGPASAGGRGLILVALVGFLSGLLGVFVGFTVHGSRFTVHGLGLGKAYAEQAQRVEDRETGKQGDRERGRQGAEVRAESRDGRSPGVVAEDEEMRAVDEKLKTDREKSSGHIILDPGTGNVGIGTTEPTATLDIDGQIRIRGGTPAAGRVLRTDADGLASWQDPAEIELPSGTSGQTLRHSGTSWIANSLLFNNGTNIGIGTTSPAHRLHVVDSVAGTTGWVINAHATGDGLLGSGSNTLTYGSSGSGDGLLGTSDEGFGVIGTFFDGLDVNLWGALGTSGAGVYGSNDNSTGFGIRGVNTHLSGTGVVGTGNNLGATYLPGGSGGAFTSNNVGVAGFGTDVNHAWGVYGISYGDGGIGVVGISDSLAGVGVKGQANAVHGVGVMAASGGSGGWRPPPGQDAGLTGSGRYYGLFGIGTRTTAGSQGRGVVGLGNNYSSVPSWFGMGVMGVTNVTGGIPGVMGISTAATHCVGVVGLGGNLTSFIHHANGVGVVGQGRFGVMANAVNTGAGSGHFAFWGRGDGIMGVGRYVDNRWAPNAHHWGFMGTSTFAWWRVHARALITTSRREEKRDIHKFGDAEYALAMADIDRITPYFFKDRLSTDELEPGNEGKYQPNKRLGIMVAEAPHYIQDAAFSGIDIYSLATLALVGVKYLRGEIQEIRKELGLPEKDVEGLISDISPELMEQLRVADWKIEQIQQYWAEEAAKIEKLTVSESRAGEPQELIRQETVEKADILTIEKEQIKKITVPNNEEMGLLEMEKEWSGWEESEPVKLHRDTEIQQIMLEIERLNQRVKNLQKE